MGTLGRQPPQLACSFCGRLQRKTRKLVAGPGVYICEKCVEIADAVISSGQTAETAQGPLQPVPEDGTRQRCSFCGKNRRHVTGLATTESGTIWGRLRQIVPLAWWASSPWAGAQGAGRNQMAKCGLSETRRRPATATMSFRAWQSAMTAK